MSKKMATIDDDAVISPDPNVGIQAMDGLAYSLDSPTLKDMYLELLATAASSEHQSDAHPSFASIIRQLTAREAPRLPDVLELEHFGKIAHLMLVADGGKSQFLERHVLDLYDERTGEADLEPGIAGMIDSWTRLGLVATSYDT